MSEVRGWARRRQVQPLWLGYLSVAFLLIGTLLAVDAYRFIDEPWARFTSRSYHWIFYWVPITVWCYVFWASAVLLLTAAITWHRSVNWVQPLAVAVSIGVPAMWAAGLITATFTGYATGNTGPIVWTLITLWGVQITRHDRG